LVDNSGYRKRPSKLTTGFPLASPAARRLQRRFDAGEASGAKGQYRLTMQTDLTAVVVALADNQALEPRHHDHGLTGDWRDHRGLRIKGITVPP
jgi:mRNA-degrading endonuclease YafQ of YafQ-DinJ toxin-antitoxin module